MLHPVIHPVNLPIGGGGDPVPCHLQRVLMIREFWLKPAAHHNISSELWVVRGLLCLDSEQDCRKIIQMMMMMRQKSTLTSTNITQKKNSTKIWVKFGMRLSYWSWSGFGSGFWIQILVCTVHIWIWILNPDSDLYRTHLDKNSVWLGYDPNIDKLFVIIYIWIQIVDLDSWSRSFLFFLNYQVTHNVYAQMWMTLAYSLLEWPKND